MVIQKLFTNGTSQAIRIPRKFRFKGERVIVKKHGRGLLILPEEDGWKTLRSAAENFSPDFMENVADLPPDDVNGFR